MQITRREFLAAAPAAAAPSGRQPNVMLLMSDQQHWKAAGFMDRFFETPNLDRLANESACFEYSFCSTPQCSPSRSSIFTGCYPSRTGVYGNTGSEGGNDLKMKTVGARLREAGYQTAYFGKWHLGNDATANAGWNEELKQQGDPEVTRRAVEFLRRQQPGGKPFLMVTSYINPHDVYEFRPGKDTAGGPVTLSKSWQEEGFANKPPIQKQFMTEDQGSLIWEKDRRTWEAYREFYRHKTALYDAEIGRLLDALRERGLDGETIVIATSDHGDMDTNHKLIFKGPFMYEHMVRIPLVVRVPKAFGGRTPGRVAGFDAVNVDITPTLLDFAGLPAGDCQGQSLKPVLTGASMRNRPFVISEYYSKQKWVNPIRMIRTRELKYNLHIRHGEEFYDLRNDPDELRNLASDAGFAKRKAELRAELERWMKSNSDPFFTFQSTGRNGKPLT